MQTLQELPEDLQQAVNALGRGEFVLLHDSKSRENEVDLIVAAERITPAQVFTMRRDAGGLLCVAIDHSVGKRLGIGYLHDIFDSSASRFPILRDLAEEREAYGDRPAFSITVNHRRTFTGVTDQDRALTISHLGQICKKVLDNDPGARREFVRQFKSPGHVYLLLESEGSLSRRRGHTELSVYLCKLAGITPAAAICEMLDGRTHRALSVDDAESYAQEHKLCIIDGGALLNHFELEEHELDQ
jgi:3,4-dihydroxy 2-butanone 4-phosphate synthase